MSASISSFLLLFLLSIAVLLIQPSSSTSPQQLQQHQQNLQSQNPNFPRRVAIIGAGSAGSSTAYYLHKQASSIPISHNITVFERSDYVGGRSTTVNAFGLPSEPVELGASIFVKANKNLYSAVQEFGLQLEGTATETTATGTASSASSSGEDDNKIEVDDSLGIWDSEKFVFQQNSGGSYWWDVVKLLLKYGLSPIRAQNLAKATVENFLRMYEAPIFPFRSLTGAASDLGLLDVTAVTGDKYLAANDISDGFANDIIQASTRVNYGQNLDVIHGLETMVCMATDDAMSVKGGNWRIFDAMLKASGANIALNTSVTEIRRNENATYTLITSRSPAESNSVSEEAHLFDEVVLAAPYQYSSISISPLPKHVPDHIPYVKLHVSLFSSPHALSPAYFNMAPESNSNSKSKVPFVILTTLPPDYPRPSNPGDDNAPPSSAVGPAGFWSISTLRTITNPRTQRKEYLYKIFSPEALTPDFLSEVLGFSLPEKEEKENGNDQKSNPFSGIPEEDISWSYTKVWNSYPYEYPRVTFEPLLLDGDEEEISSSSPSSSSPLSAVDNGTRVSTAGREGLWYTSGIESFISTMETSSLMGSNVASLIAGIWEQEM